METVIIIVFLFVLYIICFPDDGDDGADIYD